MTDKKISELTNITGANLADADEFVVVDSSASETKAITWAELKEGLDTGTGFVRITGDTMTGDLSFGDNDKAIFGAGSDLQIYHDGDHSFVRDAGTGHLKLQGSNLKLQDDSGNNYVDCIEGSYVQLTHNANPKLTTTSTGVDVTGTITSDGLTVDGVGLFQGDSGMASGSGTPVTLQIKDTSAGGSWVAGNVHAALDFFSSDGSGIGAGVRGRIGVAQETAVGGVSSVNIQVAPTTAGTLQTALKLDHNGDISFYEDTGTTPKFFWDASEEKLEIGGIEGGADGLLAVKTNADNHAIAIEEASGSEAYAIGVEADGSLGFYNSGSTTASVLFDDSGNVGIGTTSPTSGRRLHVFDSGDAILRVETTTAAGDGRLELIGDSGGVSQIRFGDEAEVNVGLLTYSHVDDSMGFSTDGSERMSIDSDGNVGIGETNPFVRLDVRDSIADTTTAKASRSILSVSNEDTTSTAASMLVLRSNQGDTTRERAILEAGLEGTTGGYLGFWTRPDGSAITEKMRIDADGNVGIGTDSPTSTLHVNRGSNGNILHIQGASDAWDFIIKGTNTQQTDSVLYEMGMYRDDGASDPNTVLKFGRGGNVQNGFFAIDQNGSEAIRIDSDGNVGIGTDSPNRSLHVVGTATFETTTGNGAFLFIPTDTDNRLYSRAGNTSGSPLPLSFFMGGTERMRIDSSGNFLVGTTSSPTTLATTGSVEGFGYDANDFAVISRASGNPLILNRLTDDGSILSLRKNGAVVGSIGTTGGDVTLDGGSGHTGIRVGNSGIWPQYNGALDNGLNVDLGYASGRFRNLYLSGGVYLGGTTSVNLLDDYETGTWTPSPSRFTGGGITATYNTQDGYYTKVGNLVTCSFKIDIASISSQGTSFTYIGGLPYAPARSYYDAGATGNNTGLATVDVVSFVAHSDSRLFLRQSGNTSSNSTADWAVGNLSGTITYMTS